MKYKLLKKGNKFNVIVKLLGVAVRVKSFTNVSKAVTWIAKRA